MEESACPFNVGPNPTEVHTGSYEAARHPSTHSAPVCVSPRVRTGLDGRHGATRHLLVTPRGDRLVIIGHHLQQPFGRPVK